jgi:hypothetical protein
LSAASDHDDRRPLVRVALRLLEPLVDRERLAPLDLKVNSRDVVVQVTDRHGGGATAAVQINSVSS